MSDAVTSKDCFHRVFVQWPDGSYINSLDLDFPTTFQRMVEELGRPSLVEFRAHSEGWVEDAREVEDLKPADIIKKHGELAGQCDALKNELYEHIHESAWNLCNEQGYELIAGNGTYLIVSQTDRRDTLNTDKGSKTCLGQRMFQWSEHGSPTLCWEGENYDEPEMGPPELVELIEALYTIGFPNL